MYVCKVRAKIPTNSAKDSHAEHPEAIVTAKQLLFEDAMSATDQLLSEGRLTNLNVQSIDEVNHNVHCSVGRFGEDGVQALYGVNTLPVLSAETKLAKLIV